MVKQSELMNIPVFLGLDEEILENLIPLVRRQEIPTGTTIFREGNEAEGIFFLEEGNVDISIHEPAPGGGTVHVVRAGECFGWSAIVPPHICTATAVTKNDSRILVINAKALKIQMGTNPALAWSIFENIASTIARRLEGTRVRLLLTTLGYRHALKETKDEYVSLTQ